MRHLIKKILPPMGSLCWWLYCIRIKSVPKGIIKVECVKCVKSLANVRASKRFIHDSSVHLYLVVAQSVVSSHERAWDWAWNGSQCVQKICWQTSYIVLRLLMSPLIWLIQLISLSIYLSKSCLFYSFFFYYFSSFSPYMTWRAAKWCSG